MSGASQSSKRPLSPHLQVYKPLFTMMMSIVHRITGTGLYFGMAFVVWWLWAIATGPQAYYQFQSFFTSWFGIVLLVGFSWALMHHMLGGFRHFIWDLGYGYSEKSRNNLAKATLAGSLLLTALIWFIAGFIL
jgi:succinate dehydrogenase / fumarate reductase cytochrome b subunit